MYKFMHVIIAPIPPFELTNNRTFAMSATNCIIIWKAIFDSKLVLFRQHFAAGNMLPSLIEKLTNSVTFKVKFQIIHCTIQIFWLQILKFPCEALKFVVFLGTLIFRLGIWITHHKPQTIFTATNWRGLT